MSPRHTIFTALLAGWSMVIVPATAKPGNPASLPAAPAQPATSALPAAEPPTLAVRNSARPTNLPAQPSELYLKLSEATRPQWRQHYRTTVTRCLEGRPQAAMGLGAVTADLFLAAQARDTQQIRNLLQDEETIEKTLGLVEDMSSLRTEVLSAAEQSDWPRLHAGIEKLSTGQRRHFRSQKDEPLADLAYIGQWMRTLQTCHAVVISRSLEDQSLAIGDPRLIPEMTRRLRTLSDPANETTRCLRLLHIRLAGLSRLWPEDGGTPTDPAARLQRSAELLSDTVGQLLQEADPAPARKP